jgi:hypothetical protein
MVPPPMNTPHLPWAEALTVSSSSIAERRNVLMVLTFSEWKMENREWKIVSVLHRLCALRLLTFA